MPLAVAASSQVITFSLKTMASNSSPGGERWLLGLGAVDDAVDEAA